MIPRIFAFVITTFACGHAVADDPAPVPKDVPPVVGMAAVVDGGKINESGEWGIRLTVPKVAWEVVGEMVPKRQWPELRAEVETVTITLKLDGPSALTPSRVVDLKGQDLPRDQVIKRLEKATPLLISVSGRAPEPYYLQLAKPDTLVIILGPRDGAPAPQLLPVNKAVAGKREKAQ